MLVTVLMLRVTIDCVYRWLQWCVKGVQCCWQILWKLIVKNTGCPVQFLSEGPTALILNLAWFLLCSSPFKLTYRREGKEAARGRQIVESSKRRGYFWKRVRGYGWRGEMNFWKTFLNVPCQNIHARKQPRFGSARKLKLCRSHRLVFEASRCRVILTLPVSVRGLCCWVMGVYRVHVCVSV